MIALAITFALCASESLSTVENTDDLRTAAEDMFVPEKFCNCCDIPALVCKSLRSCWIPKILGSLAQFHVGNGADAGLLSLQNAGNQFVMEGTEPTPGLCNRVE
jgi:hypothetical protein